MVHGPAPEPAVKIAGLSFRYGSQLALIDLTLDVLGGEIFGLLGPNGGGKSTLFKLLTTSMAMQSGAASVGGADVTTAPMSVRRQIGVVFQQPSLDKKLTVAENLKHHARLYGMDDKTARARTDEMLDRFGLAGRRHERVETLSGGLARRVELAKATMHRPKLLILDEPSTGLDPGARMDLWHYLKQAQVEGATVLLTTHWMEEAERCDRIGILHEGRLAAVGTPADLRSAVGGDVVVLHADEPEAVVDRIRREIAGSAVLVDGEIRVAAVDGFALGGRIAATLGPCLRSLMVSRPTLEDVFVQKTGRRFWMNEQDEG